ncbi:hypothetical protein THRCLA_08162 [Thraustotheca clavata]|uniref:Squalene synthase n=1 Tax=Thraustotheca clavata TaxID=74557 RepID=A0A1V9Z957_9STRA|nr:hypothetical protein THRCLA_08162 [Thraustotheca clavata]
MVVGIALSLDGVREGLENVFASLSVTFHDHMLVVVGGLALLAFVVKFIKPSTSKDESKKQGAYGSIVIHKESKMAQLMHPWEVVSLVKMLAQTKLGQGKAQLPNMDQDSTWCFKMVKKVSRSFAMVIISLPEELRLSICVFYLALRALDTVEDDMKRIDSKTKIKMLQNFYLQLSDVNLSIKGIGEGDEATVLEEIAHMNKALATLPNSHQEIIIDITRKMGVGMAEFVEVDMGQGTVKTADYDKYCYYVAGLVGEGLSRLFSASGLESPSVGENIELSISMGRFLQKVNIIRDYLEDFVEGRTFWPQEIWKKHMNNLGDMRDPSKEVASLNCLNEMVFDALRHVPDCMEYLSSIQNPGVLFFCAMPQVMAVATLAKLYNNPKVFTGVVKIRKGTAAFLMEHATSMPKVRGMFAEFVMDIQAKGVSSERQATLVKALNAIHADHLEAPNMGGIVLLAFSCLVGSVAFLVSTRGYVLPPLTDAAGVASLAILFASVAILLAFGFTPFATADKKQKIE